jgi:hypothetical protein
VHRIKKALVAEKTNHPLGKTFRKPVPFRELPQGRNQLGSVPALGAQLTQFFF